MSTEQLSLRALGMISLFSQKRREGMSVDQMALNISDTMSYIENTAKELEALGILTKIVQHDKTIRYALSSSIQNIYGNVKTIQDRVIDMFADNRLYSLIAWFLSESHVDYTSDKALKARVEEEFAAAKVIQFWDDDTIFSTMAELQSKNPGKTLHMSMLLKYLDARSRGEL